MPVPAAFDFEGPIANPAIDVAHIVYNELISDATKQRYPRQVFEAFDAYDDARWLAERSRGGHSTGTTPLLVDCFAAVDGLGDYAFTELAMKRMESDMVYNPGAKRFLGSVRGRGPTYIVTSSYPAMPLIAAYDNGLGLRNVFTHGRQPNGEKSLQVHDEIDHRSPMTVLTAHPAELAQFLDEYLPACDNILRLTGNGHATHVASREHDEVFSRVTIPQLRRELEYMFLSQKGVMGGHRKKHVLQSIAPDGNIAFMGDGIVDADALRFARYGFPINCTNREALQASKLNFVTDDIMTLYELFNDVQGGMFTFESAAKRYACDDLVIFTPGEIAECVDDVKKENARMKAALKEQYAAASV